MAVFKHGEPQGLGFDRWASWLSRQRADQRMKAALKKKNKNPFKRELEFSFTCESKVRLYLLHKRW